MSAAPYGLLSSIHSPQDLRDLTPDQLEELSLEIRSFLIEHVCQTGGHLGPNLGVIELTLAVHRIFDSPRDPIIFDTGHQGYVHKIRPAAKTNSDVAAAPRAVGVPSPAESEHDWVANPHASTALSYAGRAGEGHSMQRKRHGGRIRRRWFAHRRYGLGGSEQHRRLRRPAHGHVVNDNGRSYTPTVGGLARY